MFATDDAQPASLLLGYRVPVSPGVAGMIDHIPEGQRYGCQLSSVTRARNRILVNCVSNGDVMLPRSYSRSGDASSNTHAHENMC